MINIAFLVPYPELINTVESVYQKKQELRKVQDINIKFDRRAKINEYMADPDIDVIVVRSASNTLSLPVSKNAPGKAVVEIPVTISDIITALNSCIDQYNPDRIGIVCPALSQKEFELLRSTFSCELEFFYTEDANSIPRILQSAANRGFYNFIGGDIVRSYATGMGLNCSIIPVGEDAIAQALEEASHIANILTRELVNNGMMLTVINSIHDAVLYVSSGNRIRLANEACEKVLKRSPSTLVGCSVLSLSASLSQVVNNCTSSKMTTTNRIIKYGVDTLSVNCIPTNEKGRIVGCVLTIQNITHIQNIETQIRKQVNEKGLYARYSFDDVIHRNERISRLISVAQKYAQAKSNLLITGETGTGKEIFAQSIHNYSSRRSGPFVAVNCAAIPENLLESELFGYSEGAFTGSKKGGKPGLFELAHNGTIFLDEIAELPLGLQGKLLRVLQEEEVRRVGSDSVKKINIRVISATNKDLWAMVNEGQFRQDLYYRINILNLNIPPLRERKEDIELLFCHYLQKFSENSIPSMNIEPDAMDIIISHRYTGNIRELRNLAERLSIICGDSGYIRAEDVVYALSFDMQNMETNNNVSTSVNREKIRIMEALEQCMYNQSKTAKMLSMDRSTLWRKMKKYNISVK